jgi:magnesium-transporting ATPase (P-type)
LINASVSGAACNETAGALASKEEDKDPIDLAVIQALEDPSALKTYRQVAYVPFDPVAKRTEATIADGAGREFKVSKGMPPVIFKLCDITGDNLAKAQKIVSDYAAKGYRIRRCGQNGMFRTLDDAPTAHCISPTDVAAMPRLCRADHKIGTA